MIKVKQFEHANQFILTDGKKTIFQSYDSIIAVLEDGILTLGYNWDYSKTTRNHLYKFIEEYIFIKGFNKTMISKKYIQSLIDNGVINYDSNL